MFINFGNTNNTSFVIVINKSKETQKKRNNFSLTTR